MASRGAEQRVVLEAREQARTSEQQLRQQLVELGHRTRFVDAELSRSLEAAAIAIPDFALRLSRAHEEHAARGFAADQHERGFGLIETRQVVEIRVLPKFVGDVVVSDGWRSRERDQHAAAELCEQSLTPANERRKINHDMRLITRLDGPFPQSAPKGPKRGRAAHPSPAHRPGPLLPALPTAPSGRRPKRRGSALNARAPRASATEQVGRARQRSRREPDRNARTERAPTEKTGFDQRSAPGYHL